MSYLPDQELRYRNQSPVVVLCDDCGGQFECLFKSGERNWKKYGRHRCHLCTGVPPKPQNRPSYWTAERKAALGASMRTSEAYRASVAARDFAGENNPMFGRKASEKTRKQMSASRTGKIGPLATAWKGGVTSVTKRVKKGIHARHDWNGRASVPT